MTTAVEKYDQLPDNIKPELSAISECDPRVVLEDTERFLEKSELIQQIVAGTIATVFIGFFIFWLGLPRSVFDFFVGFFAVCFVVLLAYMIALAAVMLASQGFYVLVLKKTSKHQFFWAVDNAFKQYRVKRDAQENARKTAFANAVQADFDTVKAHHKSRKSIYMPRSLLKFNPDELAAIALEYAKTWANKDGKLKDDRQSQIEYFRNITFLLEFVDEDRIVELEDRIAKANDLTVKRLSETQNPSDPLIIELAKESARISDTPELQEARTRRSERKYLERFQAAFPNAKQ